MLIKFCILHFHLSLIGLCSVLQHPFKHRMSPEGTIVPGELNRNSVCIDWIPGIYGFAPWSVEKKAEISMKFWKFLCLVFISGVLKIPNILKIHDKNKDFNNMIVIKIKSYWWNEIRLEIQGHYFWMFYCNDIGIVIIINREIN